jgi:hypothetical protein
MENRGLGHLVLLTGERGGTVLCMLFQVFIKAWQPRLIQPKCDSEVSLIH